MTTSKYMLLMIGLLGAAVAGLTAGIVMYALGAAILTAVGTGAGACVSVAGLFFAGVAAFR
ncbi:hypothetical protein PUR61_05200 [Streptomyces sp. BE20]|uniref:hypothetical protein n=1 Tax=Streptomyces sp. BE20 TaxID=3002525 RepID=UPI002E76DA16|nr:hypothetical protein [Streptomyces sp. BE20]MEE1821594.1 hypothetical protein [Streptomyces sp. BE20]